MPPNRSLDDFATSAPDDASAEEAAADAEGEDGGEMDAAGPAPAEDTAVAEESEDDVVAPPSVSPAVSTSRFAPSGEACACCGDRVERTWVQDGDVVCDSCKSW